MTIPGSVDVLVVGAGPAGAVAATALAREGMWVLLADPEGAEDGAAGAEGVAGQGANAYGVMVSGPALRGLAAVGVPGFALSRPIDVIDLRFGATSRRAITGAGAAVCDRDLLRRTLRRAAAAAGARSVRGTVTSLARAHDGYQAQLEIAGVTASVTARHVVVAVGSGHDNRGLAPDRLPHAAGLACARRFSGARLDARLVLALATPSTSDPDEQPSRAWVLPGRDGLVTVGTARVGGSGPAGPADLLDTALRTLAAADAHFAALRPAGPLISGPINTGFAPARLKRSQFLLIGDAAGLVNPFTGEGLSYAVQSALLAARAIASNKSDPDAARRGYVRRLGAAFVGYFETARHAARRYHLAWRILAAGADSDHPFFAKGRRAILLPEGFSGLTAAERIDLTHPDAAAIGPFLIACDEVAITTVREEWPFLARLALAGETLGHQGLRPAVPFFAALIAGGTRPDIRRATLGAAIELALLGALALLGPAPPPVPGRSIDWALATTVLAGDFLLAQAARLVAESAPEVSWSFADWLAELADLRSATLDPHRPGQARAVYASLFEFPARIGAQLGGCPPETVLALRDCGRQCGRVFLHAEDVLALRGERTRLDTTLAVMLSGRFSGIQDAQGGAPVSEELLAGDPARRASALATATAACDDARRRALFAIDVTVPAAGRILREFIETLAAPIQPAAVPLLDAEIVREKA